jgi:hypothetical protein
MARKKQKQAHATLPQSSDEVWEVGRRPLDVSVAELDLSGTQPELVLVIQVNEPGGVVLGRPLAADAPLTALADVVQQAMQQPLFGAPRRPAVVRVGSQAEADVLRERLVPAGIAIEVTDQLDAIDAVHMQMAEMLGGIGSDYRTRAAQVGESLSEEGLRELFRTARHFYRRALWEIYDDTAIFTFSFQPRNGPAKTLYGVLMGSMGQELGLALYTSIEDIEQFYGLEADDAPFSQDLSQGDPGDAGWQDEDDMASPFPSIPCTSLTFEHQEDVPAPLLEEVQQLNLPIASRTAIPLFVCIGETGMQAAPPSVLADMSVVLEAMLAWDEHIANIDLEDEIAETVSIQLPAIEAFRSALTVQVTLIDNPFVFEEEDDDFDDDVPSLDVHALLETMQSPLVDLDVPESRQRASSKPPMASEADATSGAAAKVYTVKVYLTDGPISEAYANREISRQIHILGNQSLHDLHLAIFDAFERWEEHLYEFNFGAGAHDRSHIYCYQGGWAMDQDVGDPETTSLEGLHLDMGQRFGYTFDLGAQWEHVIEVMAIKDNPGGGGYPRLGKKEGAAPPQYDDDLEGDLDDDAS